MKQFNRNSKPKRKHGKWADGSGRRSDKDDESAADVRNMIHRVIRNDSPDFTPCDVSPDFRKYSPFDDEQDYHKSFA